VPYNAPCVPVPAAVLTTVAQAHSPADEMAALLTEADRAIEVASGNYADEVHWWQDAVDGRDFVLEFYETYRPTLADADAAALDAQVASMNSGFSALKEGNPRFRMTTH